MEGSTPQTYSREFKKRRLKRVNFRQNKKKFLIGGGIALVILLAGAGYALFEYLKPVYVIGNTKITREDISQYAKALDSYKAANKDLDYGGDHRDVAVDDLVLNAAFIYEMDRRNDDSYKETQELMKKRYDERDTTPEVKKMLRTRAENETYRKTMTQDLLAVKDILVVNIPLDSPLYLEKTPEEVKRLRIEAYDRLKTEFLPLMENGASKDEIGDKADVTVYDPSRAKENADWEQYTKKNVVIASFREKVIVNQKIFNDQEISDYYGVPVDGLESTSEKIAQLSRVGDTTGVFASKAGMYMIARLEKNAGGQYGSWEEFLKTYKQKYVNSKFASVVNPGSTLMSLSDKATQVLTTPGLEKAKAQTPTGGCNAHLVNFRFTSFDVDTLARIGGTAVVVNRAGQHVCGDQWEGTRGGVTYPGNDVFNTLTIQDNCWGNQLTFGILSHPANYTFVAIWTSEGYLQNPYAGWPIWTSGHINQVGDIFTDFHYVGSAPKPDRLSDLNHAQCDRIAGWIYDKNAWAWTPTIKIYFNARPGQPGSRLWDIGAATVSRTDVGTAYPHTQNKDNHGFDVDPRNAPASVGIDIRDGNPHQIFLYASSLSPGNADYEFASATIPACPAPPPTDSAMTPIASANLAPDDEEPNAATFSARVDHTGAAFNSTVLREFFVLRSGSATKEFIAAGKFTTAPASPTSNPISGTINSDWGPENLTVSDPVQPSKLNLKVGDRVCTRVTVTPGRVSVNYKGVATVIEASRTSNDQCRTLVSKPYVSVYGNDVAAGASFAPNCGTTPTNGDIKAFNKSSTFKGSGVQLAALAFGGIDGFASSFLTTKKPTYLTFANTSGTYGSSYGTYRCLPDYFSGAPAAVTGGAIDLNGDGQRKYNPGGSKAIITGNNNVKDQSAIYVDGDVVITGNIEYKQNWNSPKDVPSLYIIAKGNIYISKNVSRLDGTFIAQPKDGNTGRIYTCTEANGNLFPASSLFSECDDNQLTINGSFVAQQVRLLRTKDSLRDSAGDSASTSRAAEVFRFSPETYLATPAIPPQSSGFGTRAQFYTTLPPVL